MYWKEILVSVALLAAVVGLAIWESLRWQEFKVEHKCRVVAHIRGSTFNTMDAKGNVGVGVESDKTGWLCDDGITYYR